MKRILTLALVACFALSASLVSAKEMNFVGEFEHTLEWTDNTNFFAMDGDNTSEDDFAALQRIRIYFQYIDSETLRGVVGFELNNTWGDAASGGSIGTDGNVAALKHAYTDFTISGVSVRVGLQGLAWPSAVTGNIVMDEDIAGIIASYQFNDNFGLTAGWARLIDTQRTDATPNMDDEVDAFTLIAPITMDGWSLSPYVIYAKHGQNASSGGTAAIAGLQAVNASAVGDELDVWWAGAAFSVELFDPFVFGADLVYGAVDGSNSSINDKEGWWFTAMLTYKMEMVTPSIAILWGSGEDDDPTNGSEVMPTLSASGYSLTDFGFDGNAWTVSGGLLGGRTDYAGAALILDNFSFVENLTHKFVIAYLVGTSDSDIVKGNTGLAQSPVLTDEDSAWEINFNSTYQIYENLALTGALGYLNVDLDEDVWATSMGTAKDKVEDAWRFALTLNYNF